MPSADTHVFLDMEGDADGGFVYLIGLLVVRNGQEISYSFWADNKEDETVIFGQFAHTLSYLANAHVFHYGPYEARVLKRLAPRLGSQARALLCDDHTTNVLGMLYANIYFPTYSNSLKDIAGYLGYVWSAPRASGLEAVVWRSRWEQTRDDTLKAKLLTYNLDDCRALRVLTAFLHEVARTAPSAATSDAWLDVVSVESLDEEAFRSTHDWGKKEFAIPEFESITKCAYFDYQRSRVFLRTNPSFRHIHRRQRKRVRRPSYRVNRTVEFRARTCPYCKSADISHSDSRVCSKLSLDLRFARGGITRRVTRYRSKVYKCAQCNRSFVARAYRGQERFGHDLAAWAIHQHIANRITFKNLEATVQECFALPVDYRKIYEFKARLAQYYGSTYQHILRNIVAGQLLHVDETKVNLQKGSRYVWVFTNMEEVAFVLRPDRNAAFLHKILREFHGVLVTDYFSGYDSLKCPQQKCLVHLMRDLNDGLLADPFDEELKKLGTRFGHLLQGIVATVDRFGLRARYLRGHKPEVSRFFEAIVPEELDSEVVRKLKKRMMKYREKLFTFLDRDGVPWNNNNAEHAIKHFAKYRRLVNGRVTEEGLKDYLKLLSVYETCRYKAIGFLEFLLSMERNIDSFATRT
jgi:hypothetical protein